MLSSFFPESITERNMSGLSLLRMTRPVMRSLAGSQQLHSQMVVRMMSSQKELQYIKVDTAGDNTIRL